MTPFIDAALGRFCPFLAGEYNLITRILPPVPASYFLYNSVQLVIFAAVFSKICSIATKNKIAVWVTLLIFFTSTGVMTAWLRLFVGERNVSFWFAVCILSYLSYLNKQRVITFVIAVFSAGIPLFYKEPAFLALFSFAFLHLISSWRITKLTVKLLDVALILCAATYGLAYFFIIYLNRSSTNYAAIFGAFSFEKTALQFFANDPFLLLLLLPTVLWRISRLLLRKESFHPVYDSMLGAAITYVSVYFKLGLAGPYYLLPAYVFALPGLLHFLFPEEKLMLSRQRLLFIGAVAVITYVNAYQFPVSASVFPWSIQTLNRFKYVAINYDATLNFLVADIRKRHPNGQANIYLNLGPNSGYEAYFSLFRFLEFKGVGPEKYYLKNDILETNDSLATLTPKSPAFKYFKSTRPSQMTSGDYLIVLPLALYGYVEETHDRLVIDKKAPFYDCLDAFAPEYQLIFRTDNDWKSVFKKANAHPELQDGGLCLGEPNYYVFVRK